MQTFILFILAGAVTLFFLRGSLKGVVSGGGHPHSDSHDKDSYRACSRCTKKFPEHYPTCPNCGKSLAASA
jgi:uncharacterized paraquat-inducible protein A